MPTEYAIQRKHQRYSCDVGVQIRTERAQNGNWGALADISLGGCYVSSFSPLPPDSIVTLRVKSTDAEINISGKVVTCHPGVGMGIEFSRFITRDDEARLRGLVRALAMGA